MLSAVSFHSKRGEDDEFLAVAIADEITPLIGRWSGPQGSDCAFTFARAVLNALDLLFDAQRAHVSYVVPMAQVSRNQRKSRKRSAKRASGHQ